MSVLQEEGRKDERWARLEGPGRGGHKAVWRTYFFGTVQK
jgi:hypothetical protein